MLPSLVTAVWIWRGESMLLLVLALTRDPLVEGGDNAEEEEDDRGRGRMWCGMPPDSRILDRWSWISDEKSSLGCSNSREMGRTLFRRPMPFHSPGASESCLSLGRAGGGGDVRLELFASNDAGSKEPLVSMPALCRLNFSISSVSQARVSFSTSSGNSPSSPSVSSHESGSLKIISASALPGTPLRALKGAGDPNGESRSSRLGWLNLPLNMTIN